jgi:Flp pilus assembly protein TadB
VARRSPTNERYQKYTGPKGQTRKSAAAARVRRGSVAETKSKSKSSGKGSTKSQRPMNRYGEPATPEYKFWRKMWWYALGAGMACVTASLLLQYVVKATGVLHSVSIILIFLSYAALIVAFVVDYRRLRPLRRGEPLPGQAKKDAQAAAEKNAEKPYDEDEKGDIVP